jgi:hypothetical protein
MWVLKGAVLGSVVFFAGFFLRFIAAIVVVIVKGQQSGDASALGAIFVATVSNPFFYTALLGCILIGIFSVRKTSLSPEQIRDFIHPTSGSNSGYRSLRNPARPVEIGLPRCNGRATQAGRTSIVRSPSLSDRHRSATIPPLN